MKISALHIMVIAALLNQYAFAAEAQKTRTSEVCTTINLRDDIQSFWYVPVDRPRVHFVTLPNGDSQKKYLVKGDLIIASTEKPEFICAHYIKKGKITASGWLKKSEIEMFKPASFGASDVPESQKRIPQTNRALATLAKRLPGVRLWQGIYQDKYGNSVNIWKRGSVLRLNTMGIVGAIGTGKDEEDSLDLVTHGARAEYREDKQKHDVCDIVLIGFNNALLATSGSHCMGSGANHEYPEFNGVYWRR
jgi:hypothetical protein